MEIILNSDDLKALIEENYDGIDTIIVDKTFKATLVVDMNTFKKKRIINEIGAKRTPPGVVAPETPKIVTPKDKADLELKQGTMGAEGRRVMTRTF